MNKFRVLWLFAIPFIVCVTLGRVASGLMFRSDTGAYDKYLWVVLVASLGIAMVWGTYNFLQYRKALKASCEES